MPRLTTTKRRPAAAPPVFETVEPRHLLSGTTFSPYPADNFYPQIGALSVSVGPYAVGRPLSVIVSLSPVGHAPETPVTISLSADDVPGNADDITLGTTTAKTTGALPIAVGNLTATLPDTLTDGTYHLVATAPNAAPLVEGVITVASPSPGADLSFQIDTDPYTSGGLYRKLWPGDQTAVATVANTGADPTGPWQMAVYLSKDRIFGNADDILLGQGAPFAGASGLPASSSLFTGLPINVPDGTVPDGYYYPILVLDPLHQVPESDESNNVLVARPIVVGDPSADLTLAAVSAPSPTTAGGTLSVDVDVAVRGNYPGPIDARFQLVSDATGQTYELNNGFALLDAPFAPDAVTRVHLDLSAPPDLPAGSYHLVSAINALDYQAETDESNDLFPGVPVTVDPPPLRPFYTIRAGSDRRLPLVVTNDTPKRATQTYKVTFYLSDDPALSPDDTPFSKQSITTILRPNKSSTLLPTYKVPTSAPLGTQYLIARARPIATAKAAKGLKAHRPALHASTSSGRTTAIIPVTVTEPKLAATVRSLRRRAGVTRVTIRVTNNANRPLTSPAATIRLLRPNNAVLLTAHQPLDLPPHGHKDLHFTLPRKVPANTRATIDR
jgi:hypothetical protein